MGDKEAVGWTREQRNGRRMSVPAFGEWEIKQDVPDYSLDFSNVREHRKVTKSDFSMASIESEDESTAAMATAVSAQRSGNGHRAPPAARHHSPKGKRKSVSCFSCCARA